MYRPSHFAEHDPEVLAGLLRSAGFGHLVVHDDDGLSSTPIPFVVDDDLTSVRGHLARPNPIWRAAPATALLIVPVTDAYVSPSWYPSKQVDGKVVPTWNYEVVHVHGAFVSHDDAEWVGRQIRDLTLQNESTRVEPWAVEDAPVEFIDRQVHGIVGVELLIDRLDGKRKLSQNRSTDDAAGAVAGLSADGPRASGVAGAMQSQMTRGGAESTES